MKIKSHSEEDTVSLAVSLAGELKAGALLYLHGDLGAGKSVFARGLVRALCGDEAMDVPSPIFTLVQSYEGLCAPVYHFDLYRIEDADEIFELGWEDALYDGIVIVEWPSRLGSYMREACMDITISPVAGREHIREIEVVKHGGY